VDYPIGDSKEEYLVKEWLEGIRNNKGKFKRSLTR
jgi:hypothetical protein